MFSRPWFAPLMVILSALSGYVGAAFAVNLFTVASAPSVGWGRMAIAAVILMAWRRPWRGRGLRDYLLPASFGALLAGNTVASYLALDHIAMGPSVAIQFLGPISVAVALGRGWRVYTSVALALCGVFLISFAGLDMGSPGALIGLGFSVLTGAFWAGYIVVGKKVSESGNGLNTLSLALAFAAIFTLPFAGEAAVIFVRPSLLGLLIAVAVLSTVVTYAIDQAVLPHVPASTYALLMALSPATSLLVGVVMLRQIPNMGEFFGLVLVSFSVLLATKSGTTSVATPAAPVAIDVVPVREPSTDDILGDTPTKAVILPADNHGVPTKRVIQLSWRKAPVRRTSARRATPRKETVTKVAMRPSRRNGLK